MKKSSQFVSITLSLVGLLMSTISYAQWSTATLSEARKGLATTSVSTKVFFAGGDTDINPYFSNVVDIYDENDGTWSIANLSQARTNLIATSSNGKAFFAGGDLGWPNYSSVVDIYDNTSNTWSTANLSQERVNLSATSIKSLVFFAGGWHPQVGYFSIVDIYNTSTDSWITANLSQARASLTAASVGDKVFFAGGYTGSVSSDIIDIYNSDTDTWSTENLTQARSGIGAGAVGEKIFFAGGSSASEYFDIIDIYDNSTNTWSTEILSEPRSNISVTSVGSKVFFAGGQDENGNSNIVDIYDSSTDTWSIELLPNSVGSQAASSVGTKAFFVGKAAGLLDTDVVNVFNNDIISGTINDIDGNTYNTIIIGTQEWMKENLRTTKYANGDVIANITDNTEWANLTTGAWSYYENEEFYNDKHGKLYNWYTVGDDRQICPTGWHVGNDSDWTILNEFLGGPGIAGHKLKSSLGWYGDNNGSDESGFTAHPSGGRETYGFIGFGWFTGAGFWWSSTETMSSGGTLFLEYSSNNLFMGTANKKGGRSVRCVNNKATQLISFSSLDEKVNGDPAFQLTATSTSGLPITYTSSNISVATVVGSTVTILDAGNTVITASQSGSVNFYPANNIQQSLTVSTVPNTETDFIAFSMNEQTEPATIDAVNHTIDVEVASGSSITDLIATFTLSSGALAKVGAISQISAVTPNNFTNPVTYSISAQDGISTQGWVVKVTEAPSIATDITAFSFAEQTGSATIDAVNHTIDVEVAKGSDVTGLVATFSLSAGATAKVGITSQVSAATPNNFTNPVTYSITAEDGISTQGWVVTVTKALSDATLITAFSFPQQNENAIIDNVNHVIVIGVDHGTDVTALISTFSISSGAIAKVGTIEQISGVTSNDFSAEVIYTVIAEDGNTSQNWLISVPIAPNTESKILSFSFPNISNSVIIDEVNRSIDVEMDYGTAVTDLIATFTLSTDASAKVNSVIQQSGITANDFNNPLTYKVIAEDGITFQFWTVSLELITSIEDTWKSKFSIYPNPTTGQFYITFPINDNYTIHILDNLGNQVYSKEIQENNNEIDLRNYNDGIYTIMILKNSEMLTSYKIIKN